MPMSSSLSFIQSWIAAHGVVLSTFRIGLPLKMSLEAPSQK